MIFHHQNIEKNNNENAVESVLHGPRDDVKKVKCRVKVGVCILKLGVGVISGADYPENCPKSRYKSWGWGEEK